MKGQKQLDPCLKNLTEALEEAAEELAEMGGLCYVDPEQLARDIRDAIRLLKELK